MFEGFEISRGFSPPTVPMADFNVPNLAADFGNFSPNIGGINLQSAMTGLNVASELPMTGLTDFGGIGNWFNSTNAGELGLRSSPRTGGNVMTGGGSGIMDTINQYAKPVSTILGGAAALSQIPLSIESLNIARRGQKALEHGAQTAERAAAPQIAAAERLLPAGTDALLTGHLPPQLQSFVDNQVNAWKQEQMQQLTRAGIDPQTAATMIAGQEAQLRNQLTMQAAESLMGGGQTAAAGATTSGGQAGQLGQSEFQNANQAVSGSQQALYRLIGSGA